MYWAVLRLGICKFVNLTGFEEELKYRLPLLNKVSKKNTWEEFKYVVFKGGSLKEVGGSH